MNIQVENVGKRFGQKWVFRQLAFDFKSGKRYAVTGQNGSGKSTLLKIISGSVSPTEGKVNYSNGETVRVDEIYSHLSICAPYLDIPEEYSLEEIINFHRSFKSIEKNLTTREVIELLELTHVNDKPFRHFSSGMKQRLKLGLAILSSTPILLLDEPTTALDAKSVQWYQQMISSYSAGKTIIVFSNSKEEEYSFCEERFSISAS